MRKSVFCLCNAILPLVAGVFLYWTFRPDTIVSGWMDAVLGPCPIRSAVLSRDSISIRLCRFYLPDFLWAYSFTVVQQGFFSKASSILAFSCGFTFMVEYLQRLPGFPGVFDWRDIGAEWMAVALAVTVTTFYKKTHKGECK